MSRDRLRQALEEPLVGIGTLAAAALIAVGAPNDGRASAVRAVETGRAGERIDPIEALVSARLEAHGVLLEGIEVTPPPAID